ncbi:tetratricopeptide repeat protein [Streptomyces sp. QHH-9511]|uniref:tetratricopeptide repeat protein n=1 Tax=Streptomyces sp. QHH-9511 TaxID=2684468 RepID=UPI001317D5D3|nr:tetratricopeptide repeat protein [Streptomyces sp. QHH-9511]QGZ50665.1 tetratricopeptide repeat protein [Streptomyces sp. QHH-9511]
MRDSHRAEAERLLARAVEEEVRRSGGRIDSTALLARGRAALDTMAVGAGEEYAEYLRALEEAEAGQRSLADRFSRDAVGTPALVTAVSAVAAFGADLALGTAAGTALGAGAVVAVAGAAATVLKVTAAHWPAAHRRAGALGRPGGPEQLRLQWLTALEVRGVRPFLDQQRVLLAAQKPPQKVVAQLRGADRSAAARRRTVLEQSFGHLPDPAGPFAGRRPELAQITQWVQAGRASTTSRPTVVMLHGDPGAGRTTLAVRAAHALKDQFRGACVVDLRGGGTRGEKPLSTREALLHLLNRLGAPREQLLFRERSSAEQQVRRLAELYHQHLTGLPVTVVLDDAVDAEQVRTLLPERSDSLVLVTCRKPLDLGPDVPASVHLLPVEALDAAGAEELLREAAEAPDPGPYDAAAFDRVRELCGGLPLALRAAGSSLGRRSMSELAQLLERAGQGFEALERALSVRYFTDLDEDGRRLLRRLALAGRASLGAAAAGALLGGGGQDGARLLRELARAGLLDHVRGGAGGERYRLHDSVRGFAAARLRDEEDAAEIAAAQERLIQNYAELADAVIRMVDGKMSTRADRFGGHGFGSLDAALRWLDDESSFITAALRHAEGVDQQTVLNLLGALCDYCLLRGDLYRLGEINELTDAVGQGLLSRSVQWRTGIAARQLGELDKARTTLTSVVSLYQEAHQDAGAALALCSLGITLHHQGNLTEASAKLREALALQEPESLAADRGWTLHALAAVERDRARLAEALTLLDAALELHRENESLHGEAWAHFQRGQVCLRMGDAGRADAELRLALDLYGRTHDGRGEAWALTQLARARLVEGDIAPAVDGLRGALARHRDLEDARGEAWTLYYLGHALEERGDLDEAVRELERARTMFSRMRDVYGLACARHHSGRVTRDQRAAQTGNLRNSGFARQLLVDARADFHRIGVAHGEAWTCLELAIVDGGNGKTGQALELCEEAARLFLSYQDRRGADWALFLRCTLLPYASPGGVEVGTAVAQEELRQLVEDRHAARDGKLEDCAEAYALVLERGVQLEAGWQAWDLGMVPNRHAREVMGVPVPAQVAARDRDPGPGRLPG